MKKIKQMDMAKNLLNQALSVAYNSMPNNIASNEAKNHIKQAIRKIDLVKKKEDKKKMTQQDQFQNWWGNIESGTSNLAQAKMSEEAHAKSLSLLNSMIDQEKKKLSDLEKEDIKTQNDQMLND